MLAKPFIFARRSVAFIVFVLACVAVYLTRKYVGAYPYANSVHRSIQRFLADSIQDNTLFRSGTEDMVHRKWNFSDQCRDFPDTDGILLVMKTGASETYAKMPTQLLTSLQCLPDFLLFSDKEQQLGQWHLYNALEGMDESEIQGTSELDLYRAQLDCFVSQQNCIEVHGKHSTAWALDKYKFLHMMFRTWQLRPNQQWYVFVEADTYVFWPNLVTWLRSFVSPAEHLYVGSAALVNNFPFAHGGTGYVVSGTLLRALVEKGPEVVADMDRRAKDHCCGDVLLALAFSERLGVRVRQAHPMFNGEKPSTIPFGQSHWCEPIFTMHHMDSEEVSAAWQFEQTRRSSEILLMKDLYDTFVAPHIVDCREEWDNLSDDQCYIAPNPAALRRAEIHRYPQKEPDSQSPVEREAHRGPDECSAVCDFDGIDIEEELAKLRAQREAKGGEGDGEGGGEGGGGWEDGATEGETLKAELQQVLAAHREQIAHSTRGKLRRSCFQWRYHDGVCCTGQSIKLGASSRAPKEPWVSGWNVQGINDWVGAKGKCKKVAWREMRKM